MKMLTSRTLSLAAVLIALAIPTIAAAQAGTDICVGAGATIGGTCSPLVNLVSGSNNNTALGTNALFSNTIGFGNTAVGSNALYFNNNGANTAVGLYALYNTTGTANTGTGASALESNTMGSSNTGTGFSVLSQNTTGNYNTATGWGVLGLNSIGSSNTAAGVEALGNNVTGNNNTADGASALHFTKGNSNIGIGYNAGYNLTTGDNNIAISDPGVAGEANTIRIGTQDTQTTTFIAGIFGTFMKKSSASAVVINSNGQLGVQVSSARYKRDIHDMGDASDRLMKLRPVTFLYKADSSGTEQYGLIAEEVEKVYPELVVDNKEGKPEAVAYQVLPAMLLNEVQKQAREIAALRKQLDALRKKNNQIEALTERIDALELRARNTTPAHLASALH